MSTELPKSVPPGPTADDPKVVQLIREGKAAIKLGDKAAARSKFQEAVTLNQFSEQGWWWLASVVETDDEKRVCLGNVVVINPANDRAKTLLEQLSGNPNAGLISGEPVLEPSTGSNLLSNRRLLIAGVVAALLIVVVVVIASRGGPTAAPAAPETAVADEGSVTPGGTNPTRVAVVPVQESPTLSVTSTPSPTLPPIAPTLPPTWTPEASATRNDVTGTPLPPPPEGLKGRLMAVSGSLLIASGNLALYTIPLSKPELQPLPADPGEFAILTPDGLRLIYTRFLASTEAKTLRLMNSNGTQAGELSRLWGNKPPVANMMYPSISRNGDLLAFSAINLIQNDSTPDIYTVSLKSLSVLSTGSEISPSDINLTLAAAGSPTLEPTNTPAVTDTPIPPGFPVTQLNQVTAKDSGNNLWPALFPDGSQMVYVSDLSPLGTNTVDLYVARSDGTGQPINLTNDGLNYVEAAPEVSPNGKLIAFQAMADGAKQNDLFIMSADGSNRRQLTNESGDNIRPHFSPDGNQLAFSSTRDGKWEIYIIDLRTNITYQVTQTKFGDTTICTGWSPK